MKWTSGKARRACYIATISIPQCRSFEAAAIEEYLLEHVKTTRNSIGREW